MGLASFLCITANHFLEEISPSQFYLSMLKAAFVLSEVKESSVAGYDKDAIVKDFQENGNGKYSSFHADRMKVAKEKGEDFPALMTLRKWLEEAGVKPSEKSKQVSQPTASRSVGVSETPFSDSEQSEFDAYHKDLFVAWIASERPSVWREYFTPEKKVEFLLSQKDARIAELERLLAEKA